MFGTLWVMFGINVADITSGLLTVESKADSDGFVNVLCHKRRRYYFIINNSL